jgi:hypothetical protein
MPWTAAVPANVGHSRSSRHIEIVETEYIFSTGFFSRLGLSCRCVEAMVQGVKRKERIELTRESRRLVRVRLAEDAGMRWCSACGAEVRWVTVREAAAISGFAEREIHRRLEAGSLHFLESAGALLICFLSLTRDIR